MSKNFQPLNPFTQLKMGDVGNYAKNQTDGYFADALLLDAFHFAVKSPKACKPMPHSFSETVKAWRRADRELIKWVLHPKRFSISQIKSLYGSDVTLEIFNHARSFNPLGFETITAFHGTSLKTLHSILHFGLNQHLNERSVFGNGIYTAVDLKTAMSFATSCRGRSDSPLGKYKVVLVCRVALAPSVVRNKEKSPRGFSLDEKTPYNYLLIPNNDLVTVEKILIFKDSVSRIPFWPIAVALLAYFLFLAINFR